MKPQTNSSLNHLKQQSIEEIIIETYLENTEENYNLSYNKWIPLTDHLPLNNNELIFLCKKQGGHKTLWDAISYVSLQHILINRYKNKDNYIWEPTHWMRIQIPEAN